MLILDHARSKPSRIERNYDLSGKPDMSDLAVDISVKDPPVDRVVSRDLSVMAKKPPKRVKEGELVVPGWSHKVFSDKPPKRISLQKDVR